MEPGLKSLRDLMSLSGRVAAITGGAGHIGSAMAETLAELGCAVAIIDRTETAGTVAAAIGEKFHVPTLGVVADMADEARVRALPHEIAAALGGLDILIHSAAFVGTSGLQGWVVPFERQSVDTWRKALEVNLTSVFNLTQSATPLLKKNGHGSVIMVSSIYGELGPDLRLYEGTGMGNPAAYAASKGGLNQFARWLATVLAPDVRVNVLSPGGVARGQPQAFVERYVDRTPLARMATEEDFKGATAFLASDLSAYVTGQTINVDGGWGVW